MLYMKDAILCPGLHRAIFELKGSASVPMMIR